MKILKRMFVLVLSSVILFGCSNSTTSKNENPTDDDFVTNVSKALEARWKLSNEQSSDLSTSQLQKKYEEYLNVEMSILGEFDKYDFKDTELKEIADDYYRGLELQKEGIQYVGTDDYTNQTNTWELGYNYRVCAVHDLVSDYGLTVSSKYQEILDDFTAEYIVAKKDVTVQEYVNSLIDTVKYVKNEELSSEYLSIYTAVIENTTDVTIESLSIDADFLDANGVSIYQSSDYRGNLEPGSKVQSEIYYDNEKGEFTTMKLTFEAYYE